MKEEELCQEVMASSRPSPRSSDVRVRPPSAAPSNPPRNFCPRFSLCPRDEISSADPFLPSSSAQINIMATFFAGSLSREETG